MFFHVSPTPRPTALTEACAGGAGNAERNRRVAEGPPRRALPSDKAFMQEPRALPLGWNVDTMVSAVNLDARSITSGELRPTYGRPRTVEVPAYEIVTNAVEGGWRAPLEEWKRNLAKHVESNAMVLMAVPTARGGVLSCNNNSRERPPVPSLRFKQPPGSAPWSLAPGLRQSGTSPFTSVATPRAHTAQRGSRSGRKSYRRAAPVGNPTGRRLASASGGKSLIPTDDQSGTVTLDTARPISPTTRASLAAEPLEESDAEDEDPLGGAEGARAAAEAREKERARKVAVRDMQRDNVQAALDAAGVSGGATHTALDEETLVGGTEDVTVVEVMRKALQILYDGYGDAVDAYVGLLEPGCNTLRYIGRKEGLPADKKTLQRPQGLSWPVVDVKKTMFVKEVQRRPQVKWLGAKPKEDDDDATGTYIAAPIHSLGVSGVLGVLAVDSYQFKKSKEASWRLGPADVQTLQDVGEMLGEWLDTYRKAQVLRRVRFALQWGVVERQNMYTAAVHGLRNVVLDATWFAVTAVPTEGRQGRQTSLTVACAGNREACMQLGADAAALPRVKRVAVEEMHNGKAAAATCVSTSRQPHTLLAMMKPKGRFRPGDMAFLRTLATALSGKGGLEGTYRRAVAAELGDEALQWVATRTVDVGADASAGVAGCFAVLQPDGLTAQYVVVRGSKKELVGTLFAMEEAPEAPHDAESGLRAAMASAMPKPDAPGFPPALCQPVVTSDGHVIGALKVQLDSVSPQHESFLREQVATAATALAAAATANAARGAPWRLRNAELGLSAATSSERLAFSLRLLSLNPNTPETAPLPPVTSARSPMYAGAGAGGIFAGMQIREATKTRIRTQFNNIKMMVHPAESLTRVVEAVAQLNVGMEVGKSWSVYRSVLTNPLWVERALSWSPATAADDAFVRAWEPLQGMSPAQLAVDGPLSAHLLLEWVQCCAAIKRLSPVMRSTPVLPVIPNARRRERF